MSVPAKARRRSGRRRRATAASLVPGNLDQWNLEADGERMVTPSGLLLPVRCDDGPAMLKLLHPTSDELLAHRALCVWNGNAAVKLLRWDDRAQLLERLEGADTLVAMALAGDDERATRIIADVAGCLHVSGRNGMRRLGTRLRTLRRYRNESARPLLDAALAAHTELCVDYPDSRVLNGDLHHGNIMVAARGFVAIDPKGLAGDPTYDLANVLLNLYPHRALVMDPQRMQRCSAVIVDVLDYDCRRLLLWTLAHGCLAASWAQGDAEAESWWLEGASIARELLAEPHGWGTRPSDEFILRDDDIPF